MSSEINFDSLIDHFYSTAEQQQRIHFYDFTELIAKDSLVVLGNLQLNRLSTALAKGNRVIQLLCSQPANLNHDALDLLRSDQVTIICDQKNLENYIALFHYKQPNTLFLKPCLENIELRVILLMRDQSRVENVQKQIISVLDDRIKIFPAIDALTPHAIDDCVHEEKLPILKPIRAGKIGCFFSHLKLWRKLLRNSTSSAMLILEDDNVLVKDFVNKLRSVLAVLPPTFDLLYLHLPFELEDHTKVLQKQVVCNETCAYLISRRGASRLLQKVKGIREPLNVMLQKQVQMGDLESYAVGQSLLTNIGQQTITQDLLEGNILKSNTCASKIYLPPDSN